MRRMLRWMIPSRPMDTIAIAVAACATAAVLVNALVLQQRVHPAPIFGEQPKSAADNRQQATVKRTVPAAPAPIPVSAPVPPQRPDTTAARSRSELVLDIQRELAQRGYYDGTVDGLFGPRTGQAIRDFEQAQGLKPTGEPTEGLLARVLQARARREVTGSVPAAEPRPSTRVLAVQRVLARLGYGPLKLSGLPDPATRTAVEQFERDRGLPRTGEIGEKVVSELAVVTGTPVE